MKQVRPVKGRTVDEYAEALNEAYAELSRFKIESLTEYPNFEAIIHYEISEPEPVAVPGFSDADYDIECDGIEATETVRISLHVGANKDRRCCECSNLEWGKGCPYRDGHVRQMDPACNMFNVTIEVAP